MNITELARILKITPNELRINLPQFGFDIGRKAIKINRNVANKIIKKWPELRRQIEQQKEKAEREEQEASMETVTKKTIRIPSFITVREFADVTGAPINIILAELMKNGIFASLNERIDFETAWLVGSEIGVEIKLKDESGEKVVVEENKLKKILAGESKASLLPRPPVIVVMGHVDHGKTKLLDAIRRTNVVDGEAGGITQHIGAYQVIRHQQLITFVDTPGHEAFTAMRSRGAKIADIAILVVAADDGVKPQTIEAFRIIEAAKIPYVVAINKIDKTGADINKTKQELSSQLKIVPEDWGGKTICAPISAKLGTGIEELLDMVLLAAETEGENIKANPEAKACGTIIESNVDKGAGPVATLLIQNGTLKTGDNLTLNGINIGKVRRLDNYRSEKINDAGPATPVQIIGLKTMPKVGDIVEVGVGTKNKLRKVKGMERPVTSASSGSDENDEIKKVNIIIKSDVLGSAEAIEESLEKINTKDVKVKIIHKGLGNISDGDLKRAEASKALILGFNVLLPPAMNELARENGVEIKLYSIIYDLINEIKERMQEALGITYERIDLGRLKVLAIFKTDKNSQIVGGKVTQGKIMNNTDVEIIRGQDLAGEGKITRLQAGKQDVSTCETNEECGLEYKGKTTIAEGDKLQVFRMEPVTKKI